MKKIMIIIAVSIGIAAFLPKSANAQGCCQKGQTSSSSCHKTEKATGQSSVKMDVANDSFKVSGKCDMCKSRIEKTVKSIKGVTGAEWNASTGVLMYASNGKVKNEDVSNALIKVGHDTEFGKASDKVYNSLPGCCKYR
jgi:hypothetical protein